MSPCRRSRRRPSDSDPWDDYDYYDDEDEDEEDYDDVSRDQGSDHDDYQLNELIDDEITLGWWTSPDGAGGEPISLHVPDSEVCATTPSADLVPYQSEYEGYMGNYGNTLDRWYRRAAVVVWPLDRAFAARAEAGSQWALSELRTRIEAGDLDGARAGAESLAPFWKKIGSQAGLLGTALHVAAGLGAAETAAMLLEPFRVETVAPEHAGGLAAAGRYGEEWTRRVIAGWFGPGHYLEADRYEWVERLPGLCGFLCQIMLDRIDGLSAQIGQLNARIEEAIASFSRQVAQLDEIAGVGTTSAQELIAEIGADMSRFPTAGHLVSWAKFAPIDHSSAGKKKGSSTGKGNPWIAGTLGEIVLGASRTHTFLAERYRRIARRRGKKRAIVATGNTVLTIAYHLLCDPDARYTDLGPTFYDSKAGRDRHARHLIRQLEHSPARRSP